MQTHDIVLSVNKNVFMGLLHWEVRQSFFMSFPVDSVNYMLTNLIRGFTPRKKGFYDP